MNRDRAFLFLLALLSLAIPSALGQGRIIADDRDCEGCPPIEYDIWLRARVLDPIPYVAPDPREAVGWTEQMAVLIKAGNHVWEAVRDLQATHDWYVGRIEPHGKRSDIFTWLLDQRLCAALDDGQEICADYIWASRGRAMIMGPLIEVSRGLTARFQDFEVEFPDHTCSWIVVGFPRGNWDLSNVEKLSIVRRPSPTGESGRTKAATKEESAP